MATQTEEKNIFKDKIIALGITGGIAVYKICFLINQLKKKDAKLRLVATENSLNFITKTTLQTLAKTSVLTEQFDLRKYDINHKSLQAEADLFILAPASANTIAKIAQGIADNLLTSLLCAWQKPLIIAPAMNGGMWQNSATQQNIKNLQKRGVVIVGPQVAQTSNGEVVKGPMAEIESIFKTAQDILILQNKLKGKKVLVAGGIMQEAFDKNSFISSQNTVSKAKIMADAAFISGAKVLFINNQNIEVPYGQILAKTCGEYKKAILENIKSSDIFIFDAIKPAWQIAEQKKEGDKLILTLFPAEDFLKEILLQNSPKTLIIDLRQKEFEALNSFDEANNILRSLKIS